MAQEKVVGCQLDTLLADLTNLMTWVHSHATICPQVPWHEGVLRTEEVGKCTVIWMCAAGHGYNWPLALARSPIAAGGHRASRKRKHRQWDWHTRFRREPSGNREGASELSGRSPATPSPEKNDSSTEGELFIEEEEEPGGGGTALAQPGKVAKEEPTDGQNTTAFNIEVKEEKGAFWADYGTPLQEQKTVVINMARDELQAEETRDSEKARLLSPLNAQPWGGTVTPVMETKSVPDVAAEYIIISSDTITSSPTAHSEAEDLPKADQTAEGNSSNSSVIPTAERPGTSEDSPCAKFSLCPDDTNKETAKSQTTKKTPRSAEGKSRARLMADVKVFKDWLRARSPQEIRPMGALPPQELDALLAEFFSTLRRANGAEFSSGSLVFYHRALDRYVRQEGSSLSLLKSPEFAGSREALQARFQQLWWREKESEMEVLEGVSQEEETELRLMGVLGRFSPGSLLNLVLLNNIRAFGRRHLRGEWPVRFGNFCLVKESRTSNGDGGAVEYLEWRDPSSSPPRPLCLRALLDNLDRCPVQDFKEYARKRQTGYITPSDPFYVACRPLQSHWDDIWFVRKALTWARIERMVKVLSQQVLAIRKRNATQFAHT
uniref:Uncharacterized LOC107079625 n=1 Tax=Lepisosteus oculatus TaxID=7918 RepID=W5M0T2_LEPOC|nr:PREDICTED: uncharacterized protein LOC107079625 isoform X1 [Lepisosteus oculatus]